MRALQSAFSIHEGFRKQNKIVKVKVDVQFSGVSFVKSNVPLRHAHSSKNLTVTFSCMALGLKVGFACLCKVNPPLFLFDNDGAETVL